MNERGSPLALGHAALITATASALALGAILIVAGASIARVDGRTSRCAAHGRNFCFALPLSSTVRAIRAPEVWGELIQRAAGTRWRTAGIVGGDAAVITGEIATDGRSIVIGELNGIAVLAIVRSPRVAP